ncbi:MAG: GIY-YIG nuclease family protein [Chloroflexota bacterium]|nr:GIY-YIG nuclease family protein [Chloroflexota bacterium]MDE2684731.1 GIY-YIG nuclease family protein [Chloroflexota bacterium]
MTTPNENFQTWESVSERMPELLATLKSCELLHRDRRGQLPQVPERGIYVFYHGDRPFYVGRTDRMRQRLQEHGRPSSGHNSATLAFAMAFRIAKSQGMDSIDASSRGALQDDPEFEKWFDTTKEIVSKMGIRVVEVTDPIEQAVFEVYAALELGTIRGRGQVGFNDFENH